MDIYIPTSSKELSQRKLEEYSKFEKIINAGRRNPVWFAEFMFGIELYDYQKYSFMQSWCKKYCLWLCSRRTGKTAEASVFLQTKMLLIPNYKVYISTNSAKQSIEIFKMIEDIALQRVPQFKTCTDLFANEVDKTGNSETGFLHDPAGHTFRLYNNSYLETLSTNSEALRGKGGSVFFDETAWQSAEQMAAVEHFADTDSSAGLGVEKVHHYDPKQLPLQLIYASSAGDVEFPFYNKYVTFSKKMLLGDDNYFVVDLNVNTVLNYSSVNGQKVKSHMTREAVDKAISDDPEAAERELFNKFRKGAGQNSVLSMDTIIRNSVVRKPLLYNDTGKKKFIFTYDPARNFDGSILAIFQLVDNKEVGYKLQIENVISMVDPNSKNKTPLPMPQQLDIIKEEMIKYNGERSAEWENIEFYIDSGSGGGGISAVADQLMEDWIDKFGQSHRGIIDPEHKQYETARRKYTNAMPIVHLVDPQGYKKIIYDALGKMTKLNLIEFTSFDNKDCLLLENDKHEFENYKLNFDEKMALLQIELMKNEASYMCRYDTPNGGVQYELARDKKFNMHDDRAYCLALGAYALALKRRTDLINKPVEKKDIKEYLIPLPSQSNSISPFGNNMNRLKGFGWK